MAKNGGSKNVASQWSKLEEAVGRLQPVRVPMDRLYSAWMTLRPFMIWCIARGKGPSDVRNDDIVPYIEDAEQRRAHKVSKYRRAQNVRRAWNFAVQRIPGWPSLILSLDARRDYASFGAVKGDRVISFERSRYHPALVAEVKRYCDNGGFLYGGAIELAGKPSHQQKVSSRLARLNAALSGEALIPYPTRRLKRLAPKTLYFHSRLIYRTAAALHTSGHADVAQLKSIADVITPQAAAVLADHLCADWKPGERPGPYAADSVETLCSIAKRCGINFSVPEIMVLRELVHELLRDVEITHDLSARNLRRLSQFDDERVFAMLVALPDVVMRELEEDRAAGGLLTLKKARRAEAAVAIDILNTLPIRIGSLSALDLTRNFAAPWRRGAHGKLIVFGDQEKNEKRLEARLSPRTWRLITLHCDHYRPILPGADKSTLLFPARTSTGYTWPSQLADNITRLVKQRLKVHITVHLWRHVMGSRLHEKSDRSDDGQRLLGHVSGSAATKSYIRVRTNEAAERLRQLTDAVRGQGTRQLGYRKHRVRRRKHLGPASPLRV